MIHKASATPGFLYVNTVQQFADSIDSLMSGPSPSSPALLKKNESSHAPFETVLNQLKKLIANQYSPPAKNETQK
jgi:hypothetical protein